MDVPFVLFLILMLWFVPVAAGWAAVWWLRGIAPGGNAMIGLLWIGTRLLARFIHSTRYTGVEHIPPRDHAGGLIVISNHTGAVDPLLIQARCRFFIRWMMAFEMMDSALNVVWEHGNIIPVDRYRSDPASLREALRHVKHGGALGIFPEGRIVNPPRQVRPFYPGAGLIIARCRVPVLLVWVSGTPDATDMMGSILRPSHAHVHFVGMFDFKDEDDPKAIINTLRQKIADLSGWPINDEELRPGGTSGGEGNMPPPRKKKPRRH